MISGDFFVGHNFLYRPLLISREFVMRLVGLIIIPGAFFLVGLTIIFFADDSCLCRAWPLVAPNEGRGSGRKYKSVKNLD